MKPIQAKLNGQYVLIVNFVCDSMNGSILGVYVTPKGDIGSCSIDKFEKGTVIV